MSNTVLVIASVIIFASFMITPAFAKEVPEWIKDTAGMWANGEVDDADFMHSMEFLVNQERIYAPVPTGTPVENSVPSWMKANAGWLADGLIPDHDFLNAVQFMLDEGIMIMAHAEDVMEMDSTDVAKEMSDEAEEMIMDKAAQSSTEISEEMDDVPVTTHMGNFVGLQGHDVEGVAKIISVDDKRYLRFEDFTVTNGPDLFVYIAPGGDVSQGLLLERLKGSTGNQNYAIPSHIDVSEHDTAVVYCKLFGVYFAEAKLS